MCVHVRMCVCVSFQMTHLRVSGRYVSAPVDPQQCIVGQREVELDIGGVVHCQVEPPEQTRRDGLSLLGPNVHLPSVYGTATHPLIYRRQQHTHTHTECTDTHTNTRTQIV